MSYLSASLVKITSSSAEQLFAGFAGGLGGGDYEKERCGNRKEGGNSL